MTPVFFLSLLLLHSGGAKQQFRASVDTRMKTSECVLIVYTNIFLPAGKKNNPPKTPQGAKLGKCLQN